MYSPGRLSRSVLLVLTLLAAVPALYGGGKQDEALTRADLLIKEKRYSEALAILSDYARRNPQDFDHAQARIKKIITFRDNYNAAAQELLATLIDDSQNTQRILQLTGRLFDLDPLRIAETQDIIVRIREQALFTLNRRRFEEILARGRELTIQGNYTEALRTYTEGLDIYRDEFFNAGYGAAMEDRVRQGIAAIAGNIGSFRPAMTSLTGSVAGLEALAGQGAESQNLPGYRNAYNRVGVEMERFALLRSLYEEIEGDFQEDLARIRQTDPAMGDRNFLAFAVGLMEGSPDDPYDGILGVFDTLWNRSVSTARNLLEAKSRSPYTSAVEEMEGGNYTRTAARTNLLSGYAALPLDLELRWSRYGGSRNVTLFNQAVPSQEAENYLKFRALSEMPGYLGALGALGLRLGSLREQDTVAAWRAGGNGEDLLRAEQSFTGIVRQIRTEAESLSGAFRRETAGYRELENSYPGSGSMDYIGQADSLISALTGEALALETASSIRRYTLANGMAERRVLQRERELQEGIDLFQGSVTGDNYLARHPARAAELLGRMNTAASADAQVLDALLGQYDAEPREIAGREIGTLRETAQALRSRLETARSQGSSLASVADYQANQADTLRQNGDRFFAEAQLALNQGNFDIARDRLLRAGNFYDQSLELEDNGSLRNRQNSAVPELDREIARLENQAVLRDVASMLTQTSNAYVQGDLERAEDLLTRARNTWRRTQVEENPEILYWQGMVRSGIRAGRTIPVTAPLYAEMSQFLSEAQKDYEAGSAILSDSRDEGLRRLYLARQNIQKVKLVYPMNERAGLLDLRIDQVTDPQSFTANFQERVNRAVAGTRRRDLQSYNDLLNLRTLNPRYPNWTGIISQAEIDVGLRPPPPDPLKAAQAEEIVARVRSIVRSRDLAGMAEARTALAEAINLNPGNREAAALFNEASQFIMAGTVVLDTEAERKYRQAIAALTQNNPLGARILVQEIYARNPQYRYNSRMIALEQRVRDSL